MSTTPAFYKGLGKKRCFVAIFLCFFTVFLIDLIGLSIVIEITVDYINYNINHEQFDNGKPDYDVHFFLYD